MGDYMEARKIKASLITEKVKKLFMDCNYFIGNDIYNALLKARDTEESETGKSILDQIIENDDIAKKKKYHFVKIQVWQFCLLSMGTRL